MDTQTVCYQPGVLLRGTRTVWWRVQKFYFSYISLLNHISFHKDPIIPPPLKIAIQFKCSLVLISYP